MCWTAESFWRSGLESHTIKEILKVNCILGTQKPIQQWRWPLTAWFEDATWSCLITWSWGQLCFPTGSRWWCISMHVFVDRGCVRRQHSSLCCTWSYSVVSPGEGADMWSLALALANHVSWSKVLPLPCQASLSSSVSWLSKLVTQRFFSVLTSYHFMNPSEHSLISLAQNIPLDWACNKASKG